MTVLAVANNKGGVAKTTTVASLGAAFAERGLRVLLVDLDAQACLTFSLGVPGEQAIAGVPHLLNVAQQGAADWLAHVAGEVLVPVGANLDLVPANPELAATEAGLVRRVAGERELVLAAALAPLRARYDVVLLDCAPSLGLLTLNAFAAADELIVPLQCEMLSHRGVGQLLDAVADVQAQLNPGLRLRGLLPTMFDSRSRHARAVLDDVPDRYRLPVLAPAIPRSVRFAEAPAYGRSILQTAPRSAGATAYRQVAADLLRVWGLGPRGATGRRAVRR